MRAWCATAATVAGWSVADSRRARMRWARQARKVSGSEAASARSLTAAIAWALARPVIEESSARPGRWCQVDGAGSAPEALQVDDGVQGAVVDEHVARGEVAVHVFAARQGGNRVAVVDVAAVFRAKAVC